MKRAWTGTAHTVGLTWARPGTAAVTVGSVTCVLLWACVCVTVGVPFLQCGDSVAWLACDLCGVCVTVCVQHAAAHPHHPHLEGTAHLCMLA